MIGEAAVEGLPALTLATSEGGGVEAAFVPAAGMVGCSLRHRGEELLGQRGGLRTYVAERGTMGIPLLHPWANRLARKRFPAAGREVVLDSSSMPLSVDPNGLPIHGLLAAAGDWRVEQHEPVGEGALLAGSFDFSAEDELMAAFPFPHEVLFEATLRGTTLTIATTVRASGDVTVPISFGYHPYFRLPGIDRSEWEIEIPVSERLLLDSKMLPTGEREATGVAAGRLGSRTFDDAYRAPEGFAPFVLAGGGRRIEVSFLAGYPYAQVYAPADDDVIALEPMTAPTNALVVGGPDLPLLAPGDSYEAAFSITVAGAAGQ
jgi:aldose 1-epimerase